MKTSQERVFPKLQKTINALQADSIPESRKEILKPFIDYIQSKVKSGENIRINFICTHNSRRSHLAQVWAQTMAHFFNIKNVFCYSGGTETTALFPKVAETLKNQGFQIQILSQDNNPVYAIKYVENENSIIGFSKKMDDLFNPKSDFAAIMTCDSANEACPFVPGTEQRIPITYEDPKLFDGTIQQEEKYEERSLQIASEMYYVFSKLNA